MNPLPDHVVAAILARFGDALLMGAHARDHVVGVNAGRDEGRRTRDLDVAIACPSLDAFGDATRDLARTGGTGMRFCIEGTQVDLIPFAADGGLVSPIEVVRGVQMDITGIVEAFDTADRLSAPFDRLRLPTLQAMIVLKTVAWRMRWRETDKDAQDLRLLLDCVDDGIYESRCYGPELDRFDGDPRRVGAFLTGVDAARDLPVATAACRTTWADGELVDAMRSHHSDEREAAALAQALSDLGEGSRQP